jgi:hypothetical protein
MNRFGGKDRTLLAAVFIVLSAVAAFATPAEPAELVVRGKIGRPGPFVLDLKTVMALPPVTFKTSDPWDGKVYTFTGVLLEDLLKSAGIDRNAAEVVLTAKNKYSIPVHRGDYEKYGYIVAYMIDGKVFSANPATARRGTFAVAIDFSKNKNLPVDIYKHHLVWQLVDILVQ